MRRDPCLLATNLPDLEPAALRFTGWRGSAALLCAALALSCSGRVRPLNDLASGGTTSGGASALTGGRQSSGGQSNTQTGGSLGTGGGGTDTGGARATGGSPSAGGPAATGGSDEGTGGRLGTGGATNGEPPCSSSTGLGCGSGVCRDDPEDDCDPRLTADCTGICFAPERAPICDGFGVSVPCPDGLGCVPNPRDYLGTDPSGICVGSELQFSCRIAPPEPCPDGFICIGGSIPVDGPGHCVPDGASCAGPITCDVAASACPPGYTHSIRNACVGPCIPIDTCGCSADGDCPASAVCDRLTQRCAELPGREWAPEPRCLAPFDPGTCPGESVRFAFVAGACAQVVHSGCGGNDNLFFSLEECLLRCEGRPYPNGCPDDRLARSICLSCGVAGGCSSAATACTQPCSSDLDCQGTPFFCLAGACQGSACD